MTDEPLNLEECLPQGPQSTLERQLIEEYIKNKGYSKEGFAKLPEEQRKALMKEACTYAALKLAEVEAKSQFRQDIRPPS